MLRSFWLISFISFKALGVRWFENWNTNADNVALKVLSYGVGGHYIYHVDVLFKNLPEDQVSTVFTSFTDDYMDAEKAAPGFLKVFEKGT